MATCVAVGLLVAVGVAGTNVEVGVTAKVWVGVIATVFAGQDAEATERARAYFTGYPPSSPSIALLRDGKLVFMLQRSDIEGRDPATIALDLKNAFEKFCVQPVKN